jgi:hypothetical protein
MSKFIKGAVDGFAVGIMAIIVLVLVLQLFR